MDSTRKSIVTSTQLWLTAVFHGMLDNSEPQVCRSHDTLTSPVNQIFDLVLCLFLRFDLINFRERHKKRKTSVQQIKRQMYLRVMFMDLTILLVRNTAQFVYDQGVGHALSRRILTKFTLANFCLSK